MILFLLSNFFAMERGYNLVEEEQSGPSIIDELCQKHCGKSFKDFISERDKEIRNMLGNAIKSRTSYMKKRAVILEQDVKSVSNKLARASKYVSDARTRISEYVSDARARISESVSDARARINKWNNFEMYLLEDDEIKKYWENDYIGMGQFINDAQNQKKALEKIILECEKLEYKLN